MQPELIVLARYMLVRAQGAGGTHGRSDQWAPWHGDVPNIDTRSPPPYLFRRRRRQLIYRQAHDRGVKVIGATAHYVTAGLDEGPIIDQDVTRISHRDDVTELTRKGRDLEVLVQARAVRRPVEHRVLTWGNRTVVFE